MPVTAPPEPTYQTKVSETPQPDPPHVLAAFDITDTGLDIHLDQSVLDLDKVKRAIELLHAALKEQCDELPDIDDSHLPDISDEEQIEIEAILDARTETDKEIARIEYVQI